MEVEGWLRLVGGAVVVSWAVYGYIRCGFDGPPSVEDKEGELVQPADRAHRMPPKRDIWRGLALWQRLLFAVSAILLGLLTTPFIFWIPLFGLSILSEELMGASIGGVYWAILFLAIWTAVAIGWLGWFLKHYYLGWKQQSKRALDDYQPPHEVI